jgi:hypothetical protein
LILVMAGAGASAAARRRFSSEAKAHEGNIKMAKPTESKGH